MEKNGPRRRGADVDSSLSAGPQNGRPRVRETVGGKAEK